MNRILSSIVVRSLALLFAASVSFGQASAQDRVAFRQAELDQMLAPVALYPDSLLSQVLMASTYPLEVVQAARWSRANPGVKGQDAVRAVEDREWDPSVKSLTAFPQILAMMDEKLDWTERLGEAFLAQQADVMDSVQALRRRAEAAGNLRSSEQMRVARQGEAIVIEPPTPEVVYVPYYNPVVVYGPWWWPAYPPVYWAPPAYYVVPAHRPVFLWGPGIVISVNFFFSQPDWHRRHVTVVHHTTIVNRSVAAAHVRPAVWQHNPDHRRGVPFRSEAARERFEQIRTDTRRDAVRNDARAVRRLEDTRTADIRQSRLDERRNAVQDRREDRRDSVPVRRDERRDAVQERREDRREATVNRITPGDAHRPDRAVSRNDERVRPAAQPETRDVQPKVVTPVIRTDPRPVVAPVIRTEARPDPRPAVIRSEPRPDPRPAAVPVIRSEPRPDPRPAAVPVIRSEPRPAPAAPVIRSEPRPAPAAPVARSEPRPDPRPAARAETRPEPRRNPVREAAPAPRPQASAPKLAPRAENNHPRNDGASRSNGGGNPQRQQSSGRDNIRKS